MNRTLGVWDLTSFGVAAIVGAGIFSTVGNAASEGGPAVVFLFLFTAIACGFSAFCYADFASRMPVAGSAYTYAYFSFGKLVGWIIGWDLLMEYAISNIAVAISWSDYFTALLAGYGYRVPSYFTLDFVTAWKNHHQVVQLLQQGLSRPDLTAHGVTDQVWKGYQAWSEAPRILDIPVVCNLPALGVIGLVTWVAYLGIQESKRISNFFVILKLLAIFVVISLGAFYVRPENWVPFAPNGVTGVFRGVSAVFFAYIGFDAVSTTAEECKDPRRDLPRGMIYSLGICTLLYILVALVLTGMLPYHKLGVGDPLAFVFGPEGVNLPWISGMISVVAVVSLFTVLLVYQLGQPRIWMAMSRDGLLPPIFAAIHPKYRTPWFSTLLTGLFVAIPALFMNLTEVTHLTSIGTLFAFMLVCSGVLLLDQRQENLTEKRLFKLPYFNSKFLFPACVMGSAVGISLLHPAGLSGFFLGDLSAAKLPMILYGIGMMGLALLCFLYELSLIPILGIACCSYLITELGIENWIRFGVWLIVGLGVYFLYGAKQGTQGDQIAASQTPN